MQAGPNSAFYISEHERFRAPISQTRRPEWQHAHASLLERRDASRLETIRVNSAREARVAASRDSERDRRTEIKLDSIFHQKVRYLESIAIEERTRLK